MLRTKQHDTREVQAARVADYLEAHPQSTAKEADAIADTGCITKVLSDMPGLGYGLQKGWRFVDCDRGKRLRQVRTYTLLYRPARNPQLELIPTE